MDSPRYRHVDCDKCRFLGTFRAHDLYYCKTAEGRPHVIARFGDAVHEYVAGWGLIDPILAHALSIVEMGDGPNWIGVPELMTSDSASWARLFSEMVAALLHARERAAVWKRLAKRVWTRSVPDKVGRFGCAARDVKMLRREAARGGEPPLFPLGTSVRVKIADRTVVAVVELSSVNGRRLLLSFDARLMLDGYSSGRMTVLWLGGAFYDLNYNQVVAIELQ